MSRQKTPRAQIAISYAEVAREYLEAQTPEDIMESNYQATQRTITLASLALVRGKRSDVHLFNELLILYPVRGKKRPKGVCPDNMVVLSEQQIEVDGSYDVPNQPPIFWVMEYVSKNSARKDYEENLEIYERLNIPYYLTCYPEHEEVTLFHRGSRRYRSLPPNAAGRLEIAELQVEMAIHEGWLRYWYQGRLLGLPEELQNTLEQTQHALAVTEASLRTTEASLRTIEASLKTTEDQLSHERQQRLAVEQELAQLRAQIAGESGGKK